MNTSHQTFALSKPHGTERIPDAVKGYVSQKLRNELYHLVLDAFQKSNISQSELAARLGKDPAFINRCLGASGNWTVDTASGLLFAINGNLVSVTQRDPSSGIKANYTQPEWLFDNKVIDFSNQQAPATTTANANAEFRKRPIGSQGRIKLHDLTHPISSTMGARRHIDFSLSVGRQQ